MDSGASLWPRGHSLLILLLSLSALATASTKAGHCSVKASPKSDVLLPCQAPEGSDLEDLVLEWTRSDLHQDYVFLFRDGRPQKDSQHQHFRDRVALSDPTMRNGNLSINLHHVGPADSGQYRCHVLCKSNVREKRSLLDKQPMRTVDLKVDIPMDIPMDIPRVKDKFPDYDLMIPSGALRFEAGVGFVATLFFSLFLQIWE